MIPPACSDSAVLLKGRYFMATDRPSDWKERDRVSEFTIHAHRLSAHMLEVTTPIYWFLESGEPEAVGSGVFLLLGDVRFLLTAEHVLQLRHTRPLFAHGVDGLVLVTGDVTRLYRLDAAEDENNVDVAMIRLSEEHWASLPETHLVTWPELDHELPEGTESHAHALLGYPATKQKGMVRGSQLHAYAYRMLGLSWTEARTAALGFNPSVSLLIGFDKRRTWGPEGQRTAPDLYGMSGSGAWRFGRRLLQVTEPPRLSAITIEWRRATRDKFVLATRIRPILAALTSKYEDVSAFVQAAILGTF
jgi:hypothetical protein